MAGLSETGLAAKAGTTVEHVRDLQAAGIVSGSADGTFLPANVQRIKVAVALERAGVPLDAVGQAITQGRLSFAFLDLSFSDPVGYTGQTYDQVAADMGWTVEFVQHVHEALGLARPEPGDLVREDDLQMFTMGQVAKGLGMSDPEVMRVLRVYGENLGRIAAAEASYFHDYTEMPLLRSGMSEAQMLEAAAQMSPAIRQMVTQLILWLYRRHQEHATIEHLVEHVETALEDAGLAIPKPARPPAMVFLDLVGYTRLTEERGDEVAAELAASLAGVVQGESRRFGGRAVKWLGDGVMFHFMDPGQAVRCSLRMVERTPAEGLPPAHVGVNAGPVIFRDGDYYGRTVNVASRIASVAGAGQVVVSEDVVRAFGADDVRFEPIGPRELKGLARPVMLYRADQAS